MIHLAFALALLSTPAVAQSCRTYETAHGSDTSCSDGTTIRTYDTTFGRTATMRRPDGTMQTCRVYRTATGEDTRCD